ncbi:rhamnan synthesis F family protein [Scrofimicrobium sp. R131]|uniref:Rhamnan synthesis F family protein n=1 Tax=Scrofimicrobium appendicitidis TaxID=3079930 RepID=A0AAU7VAL4_9ACTO
MRLPWERPAPVLSSPAAKLTVEAGDPASLSGPRIAVVSSWAATPEMSLSLSVYLRELCSYGYRVLVVSTAEFAEPLRWPHGLPDEVVVTRRQNLGYDFGSWAAGIAAYPAVRHAEHLLLTNDSLVGPFASIEPLVRRAESEADAVFMTESFQPVPHGQSFFVMLNGRALERPVLREFFQQITPQRNKDRVIRQYELPLRRVCEKAGLHTGTLFPADQIAAEHDNPTLVAWRAILFGGAPFLKRTVLLEPMFKQESIQMQQTVARTWQQRVSDWLPPANREQLPSWGRPVPTPASPRVWAYDVSAPREELGPVAEWTRVEVPVLGERRGRDLRQWWDDAWSGIEPGGQKVLLMVPEAWSQVTPEEVAQLRQWAVELGLDELEVWSPLRPVDFARTGELTPPEWVAGLVQTPPAGVLWPEPALSSGRGSLSRASGRVSYLRMMAGALLSTSTGPTTMVPGVYRPSETRAELLGFNLVEFSERNLQYWLRGAAAFAPTGFVLLFEY